MTNNIFLNSVRTFWIYTTVSFCLILAICVLSFQFGLFQQVFAQEPKSKEPVAIASTTPVPKGLSKWEKPDLAIIITAQQHGYLLPCGCSRPQVGGLERRYNFVQALKTNGWNITAVDLGDLSQKQGPVSLPNEQGLIKYRYAMNAQKKIGYSAVGFGEYETALPLFNALAEYALNEPSPRVVAANLLERDKEFPDQVAAWHKMEIQGTDIKVGVTSVVSPNVAEKIKDPRVKFGPSKSALDSVLKEMNQQNMQLRLLLYQGVLNRSPKGEPVTEALKASQTFPEFQILMCLSEEDEPSANPVVVNHENKNQSLIIRMGTKGKYVGILGVYKTGNPTQPFKFRYTIEQMSEDYLTPESAKKNHPVMELMESYAKELKNENYLSRFGQARHPVQVSAPNSNPTYVGSEKCKKCHESAYDVWKKSPHSHAYQTLVDAKEPSLRQYDPECIVCHTVGFGYQSGFSTFEKSPLLINVGCESCHGPSSEHVKKPNDESWYKLINPWKSSAMETPADKETRLGRVDQFCQKCHDIDNDVTWTNKGFERKWPKVAHPNPAAE
ncbi:MAG: multiheme c-type cytochrome [Gemmataceae bacterium]